VVKIRIICTDIETAFRTVVAYYCDLILMESHVLHVPCIYLVFDWCQIFNCWWFMSFQYLCAVLCVHVPSLPMFFGADPSLLDQIPSPIHLPAMAKTAGRHMNKTSYCICRTDLLCLGACACSSPLHWTCNIPHNMHLEFLLFSLGVLGYRIVAN
jgi:hypothetical protein